MDRTQLLAHVTGLYKAALGTMERKNGDYAQSDNSFENFIEAAAIAGTSPQQQILGRLGDKIIRIKNVTKNKDAHVDERLQDTVEDAINYLALFHAYLSAHGQKEGV